MNELQNRYLSLDTINQELLQIQAFQHAGAMYYELAVKAGGFGLKQSTGRALTQAFVKEAMSRWKISGLLTEVTLKPQPELLDTLIREGVSGKHSRQLLAQAKASAGSRHHDGVLDFYIAFYDRDVGAWKTARQKIVDGCLPLLSPFCYKTFDGLPAELQSGFFSFVIPAWIVKGQADPAAQRALQERLDVNIPFPTDLLPRVF